LENSTAILASIGILAYGITRVGIDSFYENLGVTPEEVGLSYGAILSRGLLGFITLLLGAVFLASLPVLVVSINERNKWDLRRSKLKPRERLVRETLGLDRKHPLRDVVIPYYLLFVGFMFTIFYARGNPDPDWLGSVPFFLAVLIIIFRGYWSPAAAKTSPLRTQVVATVFVFAAAALLLGVLSLSASAGEDAAGRVISGKTLDANRAFGLSWLGVLSVQAKCVTLVNVTDGKPPPQSIASSGLLYLGQANGTLILYKPASGPLRLRSPNYVVQGVDGEQCHD
jgi:hypothetical protein